MKKLKIGINGFGRIGRNAARIILRDPSLELTAVNSRSPSSSHAYLLKYDSSYGTLPHEISSGPDYIKVDGRKISVFNSDSPFEIPWGSAGIDLVIDATGKFRTKEDLMGHVKDSVKYAVLSAPAKDDMKTLVMGVNHESFDASLDRVVSNSSCTTNCLATTIKVLHENLGVVRGFMTTTHAVTDSQNLLDNSHKKEVRLRRASFASMIPSSTGSARDIVKLYPELTGKIVCSALRVPVATVSMINLVAEVKKGTDMEKLNGFYQKASKGNLKGILSVAGDELVSVDYKGSVYSSIYDGFLTGVLEKNLVNIYAWYDNEWGYTNRLVDLCRLIGIKAGLL